MEEVKGFLTIDNTFYKQREQAAYHNALLKVKNEINNYEVDNSLILNIIKQNSEVIEIFIKALHALEKLEDNNELDIMSKGQTHECNSEQEKIEVKDAKFVSKRRRKGSSS